VVNRTRPQRAARTPGVPVRQEDGRWTELLQIAATTFAERGYQSTTLQDIADQFGVLKGSLYHYIRSKDDLLYEVIHSVFTGGLENLRTLAEADTDPATRLRSIVRGHVLYLIENITETTVFLHEFAQLSEKRRTSMPVGEYAAIIRTQIVDGQRAGVVKPEVDAHLAALAVMGATNWVYRWYRPGGSRTPEDIADSFAAMLTSGLLIED
jgi:AcrR family transcriptional regulator